MLIGQKVILWFLGLILIPVLTLGVLFFYGFQNYIYNEVRNNLEYVAETQQRRVEEITNRYTRVLDAYTKRLLLPETINHYNETKDPGDIALLNESLTRTKQANGDYISISVLDLSGKVIASSEDSLIGRDYSDNSFFKENREANSTVDELSFGEDGRLQARLTGPVLMNGKPIGLITILNSAEGLQEIAKDYSQLGETGETLILRRLHNGDAQFVTNTRFDQGIALQRTFSGENTNDPAIQAVNGKSLFVDDATGYLGKEVLAVARPIDDTNWGVVVKIERSEAFEPLYTFTATAVSVTFVVLALGVFTAQYASRTLTDPLIILATEVQKMSEGKLDTRIDLEASGIQAGSEYGVLARSFNNMAENLEHLDKMKTEFIMLTSHQLRTPASSVKGFLSMLMDGYVKPGSKEAKEILESAYKENEQQLHLVNQILAVLRAENHLDEFEKSKVNLNKIVRDVAKQVRPILLEREQRISLDLPKKYRLIVGDEEKLGMIVENLVSNAIKYSPNGTRITVSAKYKISGVTLTFKDQGVGIDANDIGNLFKKFSRLNNPNADVSQSSGLGLYLVKKLVDQHGGKISVTSPGLGEGTTFTVWLPLK